MRSAPAFFLGLALLTAHGASAQSASFAPLSVSGYASIQEAIDRNPGKMIFVPAGDHDIGRSIVIRADRSGLWGPGRIVQHDPDEAIVTLEKAAGVELRDLTLTRAPGTMDSTREGIGADGCADLVIDGVRVVDNHSQKPVILIRDCDGPSVRNCVVENYMRIGIDDRTRSSDWGFAFNVIDGTGMDIRGCTGAIISGNRVLENRFKPTPEVKRKYNLGVFCKMAAVKGRLVSDKMWAAKYYNAWHQGAAIHIAQNRFGDYTQLIGNYIENAAQGLDIQSDHVIVAHNIVNNAFIGMKAMHGARNTMIVGNQFSKNDLWAIGLMPGAASHYAGDKAAHFPEANVDGHTIVANNIISDFGYGSAGWMWGHGNMVPYAIRLEKGQIPSNPPLTDVILEGNMVYDTGRDQILVDGKPRVEPPRYKYAVYITDGPGAPIGLHFAGNSFDPGTDGVSNVPLDAPDRKIKVFLFAGQSNMEGKGDGGKLTAEERSELQRAQWQIRFAYNRNPVVPLDVVPAGGNKKRFGVDSTFGPELFFGLRLAAAWPKDRFLFIKRSVGATSLYGRWNPEWTQAKAAQMGEAKAAPLYPDLIAYVHDVLAAYPKDRYEICGMLWVQGEADSNEKRRGPEPAAAYGENVRRLIESVRRDVGAPAMPFLMVAVAGGKVQAGMEEAARTMTDVAVIPKSLDPAAPNFFPTYPVGHYNYEGQKRIGNLLADAYLARYAAHYGP